MVKPLGDLHIYYFYAMKKTLDIKVVKPTDLNENNIHKVNFLNLGYSVILNK